MLYPSLRMKRYGEYGWRFSVRYFRQGLTTWYQTNTSGKGLWREVPEGRVEILTETSFSLPEKRTYAYQKLRRFWGIDDTAAQMLRQAEGLS